MPNYCVNELVIRAKDTTSIWAAIKKDGEDCPDFDKLLPYPARFRELDEAAKAWEAASKAGHHPGPRPKDGFNSGGYEWRVKNWGTKWNTSNGVLICDPDPSDEDEGGSSRLVVRFETAWSPATKLAAMIAERWPNADVSLQFWEHGMEFQGTQIYRGGTLTHDFQCPYFGHLGG